MQLLTLKSGWDRNRRYEVEDGEVRILRNGPKRETTLTVKNGWIAEIREVEYSPNSRSTRIVTTRAWNKQNVARAGIRATTNRYNAYYNLPDNGIFYEVAGLSIGNYRGRLRQITRRARFVREEFVYDNGQEAYVWTQYRKRFRLFRPNGKLWMEVTAKIRRPCKRSEDLLHRIQVTLVDIAGDGYRWSNEPNYEIRFYDGRGRESGYGKMENRQRVGVWRHGKARHYYMLGVSVKKEIYYAGPDDLDPFEVLRIENMQLRAALMKKIGPERLLKKLPFAACDTQGENQLLKADVRTAFKLDDQALQQIRARGRLDDQVAIAVLKCPSTGQLYYLRVPPGINKVEHARQWLCGVDIESIEEEYIRDRWMSRTGGRNRELSPSQEKTMNDEIERAKQLEKLEFICEA